MLKNEREREIINILKNEDGFITVKELCERLYASESSIRRDLTILENRGIIARTYGGAELVKNFSNVISFNKRSHHNINEKKLIAKKAKTLIKDGNIIFLDQSSTAFYLAAEIMNNSTLTVITNNIEILVLLANSAIKVISSGGMLSTENRSCLIGPDAHYIFENTYADIVFFSTKSLSDGGVISDCTRQEVLVRNSMLKNAQKKAFLCDGEKIGTQSSFKQASLEDIDYLVCESDKAKEFAARFSSVTII
ncbi:MAG: DeoR/GlpR transcriptional regulator [Clostridia bacterium]|nr:DeoR/GlpR transcriptional regulator [Clostridia bacterium]